LESLKERDQSQVPDFDDRIILKYILKKKFGNVVLGRVTQNRGRYWAVENTELDLWVPQNAVRSVD
jgi:hypothetical protein